MKNIIFLLLFVLNMPILCLILLNKNELVLSTNDINNDEYNFKKRNY